MIEYLHTFTKRKGDITDKKIKRRLYKKDIIRRYILCKLTPNIII